ncbi:MAG TPA: GMC family oxidoreductase [Arenibaculum sp.]|nr:GMC family oxidoreductase [Arenibaculum sp.]
MTIRDPMRDGIAAGWKVFDASALADDMMLEADVAIVGTGAGGGVAAEILARAGLRVVMVEEGPLKSTHDFRMRESDAYAQLYQESGARWTGDKAIKILQGRCVGGSTTVNWTTTFRTPASTLGYWRQRFGLVDLDPARLTPWFEAMERRLDVAAWDVPANTNNALLRLGAERLGLGSGAMRRNVEGCWDLGYCGTGCPTNAKRSMLVTTIPSALEAGAVLVHRLRAERLTRSGARVATLECTAMDAAGTRSTARRVSITARHFVIAAGAIGSPALLLRSNAPDPYGVLGRRTFLHPTAISAAVMDDRVDGFAGAPQSVYSDHFLDAGPIDGPIGFKLETPPLHPVMFATTLHGFGRDHAGLMRDFAHTHALLALLRDGFHNESPGGTVRLRADGSPVLDYPITGFLWDGVRRALRAMAEIQFAAGARRVHPIHERMPGYSSWAEAKAGIAALEMKPGAARVVSAHVMGGCGMSAEEKTGVTNAFGRHHQLENLTVCDGSLFPTSIGANPQLSIYAIAAMSARRLVDELTG